MKRRNVALFLASLVVVGCGAPVSSGPGIAGQESATVMTTSSPPAPASSPEAPSFAPSTNPPSLAPTTKPPSLAPTAGLTPAPVGSTPPARLTQEERSLVRALRTDAQRDCRPVRSDLPPRATAGIECVLGTALVDRVGVYGFDFDDQAAGLAYLERMDRAGTLGSTGDCLAGTPGDFGYDGADPEEWAWTVTYQGHDYSTSRYGCFLNDQGFANFRATCGHVYVGVLGNGKRLDELTAWALKAPPGEISGQGPGLCFGELGGGLDGGS